MPMDFAGMILQIQSTQDGVRFLNFRNQGNPIQLFS